MKSNNKFSHLQKNKASREIAWTDNILTSKLPKRAFTNPTTSMFILHIENFIKPIYQNVDLIKNWWKV